MSSTVSDIIVPELGDESVDSIMYQRRTHLACMGKELV